MKMHNFLEIVIQRGLGIYGSDLVYSMAKKSGITIDDKGHVREMNNLEQSSDAFFREYVSLTPIAKMNLKMLAKRHKMPIQL